MAERINQSLTRDDYGIINITAHVGEVAQVGEVFILLDEVRTTGRVSLCFFAPRRLRVRREARLAEALSCEACEDLFGTELILDIEAMTEEAPSYDELFKELERVRNKMDKKDLHGS